MEHNDDRLLLDRQNRSLRFLRRDRAVQTLSHNASFYSTKAIISLKLGIKQLILSFVM